MFNLGGGSSRQAAYDKGYRKEMRRQRHLARIAAQNNQRESREGYAFQERAQLEFGTDEMDFIDPYGGYDEDDLDISNEEEERLFYSTGLGL